MKVNVTETLSTGHTIEISGPNDNGGLDCFLTTPNGKYTNSLWLLEDLGEFDTDGDIRLVVDRRTLEEAREIFDPIEQTFMDS